MADVDTGKLFDLIERMPGFSPTVTKIVALANDPHSSPTDLVNTITMDPVLTAKLLKLINSAYFGLRQPIVSLHRAVIMLGFNTVKNVALSISIAGSIKVNDNFKWFTRDQFWEHSLGCAVASKALAIKLGVKSLDVEEYFISGLLHDIGVTLLIQASAEECAIIYDPDFEPEKSRSQVEKERFGMSHDELGGLIARHWAFPDSLVDSIARHHGPLDGEAGEESLQLRLAIFMANHYCNVKNISIHPPPNPDNISDDIWSAFKLSPDETMKSLEELEQTLEQAKVFLQIVEA